MTTVNTIHQELEDLKIYGVSQLPISVTIAGFESYLNALYKQLPFNRNGHTLGVKEQVCAFKQYSAGHKDRHVAVAVIIKDILNAIGNQDIVYVWQAPIHFDSDTQTMWGEIAIYDRRDLL